MASHQTETQLNVRTVQYADTNHKHRHLPTAALPLHTRTAVIAPLSLCTILPSSSLTKRSPVLERYVRAVLTAVQATGAIVTVAN